MKHLNFFRFNNLKIFLTGIVVLSGFFPVTGWGDWIQLAPKGKPFLGEDGHVTLQASGDNVSVITDHGKLVHYEDKGWCAEDQEKLYCHNQYPTQIVLKNATGKSIVRINMSRDTLTIYSQPFQLRNRSLTFRYSKNPEYPNGPYTTTTVDYRFKTQKVNINRSFTYIQRSKAANRCIEPLKLETFSTPNSRSGMAGCH